MDKPNVSTFIYCDSIRSEGNQGNLILENPKQVFIPEFLPSLFSFSIAVGILNIDEGKRLNFRYVFKNPNDETLIDTGTVPVDAQKGQVEIPREYQGFLLNTDFRNIPFKVEGEYYSELYVEGEYLGKFPIYVKGKEKL